MFIRDGLITTSLMIINIMFCSPFCEKGAKATRQHFAVCVIFKNKKNDKNIVANGKSSINAFSGSVKLFAVML